MILYVGDDIVDLYPKALVFYTVQRLDVGNLAGRSVNYTNNLTAPWTENNERIFGFAKHENSRTTLTYTLRQCKIVSKGVEMIVNNVLYITKSNDKEFSLQIFENIFDWFQAVLNKNIGDLEPITSSGWEASDIDVARLNTDGIITAVVQFQDGVIYDADFFLPSFFYHTLIKAILEYTGLSLSGNILTDARFTDLVIPYPGDKFEYPESYFSQFYKVNDSAGTHPVSSLYDPNEIFVVGFSPFTHEGHGTFFAYIPIGGFVWNNGNEVRIRLRNNGVLVAEAVVANNPAPGGIGQLTFSTFVSVGDDFDLFVWSDAPSLPGTDLVIVDDAYMEFIPDGVVNRIMVNWNVLLPEIKCSDLLADFFNRFGVIPKQVGNTLVLKTIDEILAGVAESVDWSNKLVNVSSKALDFKTTYAQENIFKYNDLVSDPGLGSGSIDIENTTLPISKNLFSSVFGNSRTVQYLVWNLAFIPVYDSTSVDIADFKETPGLRLLTLKDFTIENSITFDAIARSDYKIGYFIDRNLDKDTGFEYFLGQFYQLLTEALQRNKVITKFYRLSEKDIVDYDPHRMMLDGQGYYLINKILNFYPDRITKVELFKVM